MARKGKYSLELKVQTVKRFREGVSYKDLAAEIGAAETTVRRWVSDTSTYGGPSKSFRHATDCGCFTCFRRKY